MANNEKIKKGYIKPTISSEEIFEKNVLACTRATTNPNPNQGCHGTLHGQG